ncbi:MAG: hypothetical protein ACEQSB_03655 [Undibacterium sp.]
METEISTALKVLEEKIALVHESVEKTRKYMFWSLVIQLAVVLLPIILLMFSVPFLLSSFSNLSGLYQGL